MADISRIPMFLRMKPLKFTRSMVFEDPTIFWEEIKNVLAVKSVANVENV